MRFVEGCAVVVAGGGRGIGRACSELLAAHGARVLVADPGVDSDGTGADQGAAATAVAAAIRAAGGEAVGIADGIGSFADGDRIVARCLEEFGAVDAVLAPAAVLRDRMIFNMREDEWRTVVDVNLSGVFGLVRAASILMRQQRAGRIVTFTSAAGLEGRAGTTNYAAAKMGIVGLTKSAALDLAKYGVRVNCISPRANTRLTRHVAATQPQDADKPIATAALGGPDDIAPLAVYLASERCQVSGKIFYCGGGHLAIYDDFVPARDVVAEDHLGVAATAELVEGRLLNDRTDP